LYACVHVKACGRSIEWKRKVDVHITHGTANLAHKLSVYKQTTRSIANCECTRCALVALCKERRRRRPSFQLQRCPCNACMGMCICMQTQTPELTSQQLVTLAASWSPDLLGPPESSPLDSSVAMQEILGLVFFCDLCST